MSPEYTVTTPHGDVALKTKRHHSEFDFVEDFLRAHEATICSMVGGARLAVAGLGLYLKHGRGGLDSNNGHKPTDS